jgi:outer membrane lipoprotein SlyB
MTTMKRFGPVFGLAGVLVLSACASPRTPTNTYQSVPQPRSVYSGYGTVQSIDTVKQDYRGVGGTGYGLGTLAGAVIGGVAGHQVGSGKGNTAATVVGSAGGAYVGHQLEKRNQAPDAYAFTVRMDGGSYQTLTQASTGGLRVGDRVRIDNGSVQRY